MQWQEFRAKFVSASFFVVSMVGFLGTEGCNKKSSAPAPAKSAGASAANTSCAQGLADITFGVQPPPTPVSASKMKTVGAELNLAATGGSYTALELSCTPDQDASVIRWNVCSQSSKSAGCYPGPTAKDYSVSLDCGSLPSLSQFQGQVVSFTVQSCVSQAHDLDLLEQNKPVDPMQLSCETPGQNFIFQLPMNASSYGSQYASILDELYNLQQQYLAVGQSAYQASTQFAAQNAPAGGVASANLNLVGSSHAGVDSSGDLVSTLKQQQDNYWTTGAASLANQGPFLLGQAMGNQEAMIDAQSEILTETDTSLNLATTEAAPASACADALGGLLGGLDTTTSTNSSTGYTPPTTTQKFNPPPPVNPVDTNPGYGPSSCIAGAETWNNEACVPVCPAGQEANINGVCESTDVSVAVSTGGGSKAGNIALATFGAVLAVAGAIGVFGRNSIIERTSSLKLRNRLTTLNFISEPHITADTITGIRENNPKLFKSPAFKQAVADLNKLNVKNGAPAIEVNQKAFKSLTHQQLTMIQDTMIVNQAKKTGIIPVNERGGSITTAEIHAGQGRGGVRVSWATQVEVLSKTATKFAAKGGGANAVEYSKVFQGVRDRVNEIRDSKTGRTSLNYTADDIKTERTKGGYKLGVGATLLKAASWGALIAGIGLSVYAGFSASNLAGDTGGKQAAVQNYLTTLSTLQSQTDGIDEGILTQEAALNELVDLENSKAKAP